ncbi:endo alpha-1,4 polygalactosaminidase [Aspergillus ellipticus CBS 707.79]|uniref:alpha-galactosidase n=1 Tax=Aspergillus ellipticus CBS 707.79 TaxID=1448320 RepID=A0A319E6R8_9EURO|nr:endo alpha-1,4 polygalactosaminidase [Aspergillus ellipticus CBS 707.79]
MLFKHLFGFILSCLSLVIETSSLAVENLSSFTNPNDDTCANDVSSAPWQPRVSSTWQIVLQEPLDTIESGFDVYDIDLDENSSDTIKAIQDKGMKAICYFSAGSSESARNDSTLFRKEDLGNLLSDWRNERWLNTRSEAVRKIMLSRLDRAAEKRCDGVDPDNVDAYSNKENGLGLTRDDSIDYVKWLATEAHKRGLSIGLKNAGEIINQTIAVMEWSVNEECAAKAECKVFSEFVRNGKAVFHVEYPKGKDRIDNIPVSEEQRKAACEAKGSERFSTLIKNSNLDKWLQRC